MIQHGSTYQTPRWQPVAWPPNASRPFAHDAPSAGTAAHPAVQIQGHGAHGVARTATFCWCLELVMLWLF